MITIHSAHPFCCPSFPASRVDLLPIFLQWVALRCRKKPYTRLYKLMVVIKIRVEKALSNKTHRNTAKIGMNQSTHRNLINDWAQKQVDRVLSPLPAPKKINSHSEQRFIILSLSVSLPFPLFPGHISMLFWHGQWPDDRRVEKVLENLLLFNWFKEN
jgi:hypothetical protein